MRRSPQLLPPTLATVFLFAPPAFAQSVDEIVAKNLEPKGGMDLLRQTSSVKMTGTFRVLQPTEMTMPMTTWAKRPNLVRQAAEARPPAGQAPPGMHAEPMKIIR